MLKFSIKYYMKCIALSIIGYVCGGFFLSFVVTETESIFSFITPAIISIIGVVIRIIILKRQLKKANIPAFEPADYFKMSMPALCLFILTAIILLCDIWVNSVGKLMYQSVFDNIKIYILLLFPGALNVDGIIYNLSYWNNMVYYVLLIVNILIYILPTLVYMTIRTKRDVSD